MATRLIRYSDGILVEVEALPGEREEISDRGAERIQRQFDSVQDSIRRLVSPLTNAIPSLKSAAQNNAEISSVEFEVSLGFEAGGNVYLAKVETSGTVKVKISFKPK